MDRVVLTLLVGLMLSLGGGPSAFAKGEVIWEGTQESKLFSLTGPKKIRITTEGVFINGRFKPAWQLSKDDACLYGLSNFPNAGYVNTSKAWDSALKKFDFVECQSIRLQARHSYKFDTKLSNLVSDNYEELCALATVGSPPMWRDNNSPHVVRAKTARLSCGVKEPKQAINVAYFLEWATPNLISKIQEEYDRVLGVRVNWVDFPTGVDMAKAMAAGDIDIAYSKGITPLVWAKLKGMSIELAGIAVAYEANDCFVRNKNHFLRGGPSQKKVGVPLSTMAEYSYRMQMQSLGVKPSSHQIIDMAPKDAANALINGTVDMACIFGGDAARIASKNAFPIMSTSEKSQNDIFSFDVISVTEDFARNHADLLTLFLKVTNEANNNWQATTSQLEKVAHVAGMGTSITRQQMSGFTFPDLKAQRDIWLGPSGKVIQASRILLGADGYQASKLFDEVMTAKYLANVDLPIPASLGVAELSVAELAGNIEALGQFTDFRRTLVMRGGKTEQSVVAFKTLSTQDTVETLGLSIMADELCETEGRFDIISKLGNFQVTCPSGYKIDGEFTPLGEGKGAIGRGVDVFGNSVQFRIEEDDGNQAQTKNTFIALLNNLGMPPAVVTDDKQNSVAAKTADNLPPKILITSLETKGMQGVVRGRVTDDTGVAQVLIDGMRIVTSGSGDFEHRTFVPVGGIILEIEAYDFAGLSSIAPLELQRDVTVDSANITFDRLIPVGKQVKTNPEALALIVGVADYENTPAKAVFADSDALMFRDFASQKLGIPPERIKSLVNADAGEREVLLAVKSWLSRMVGKEQSDVYVFFAGHGLASDNGESMYLLPYDGAPELLEDTAVSRERLFADIAAAKPRSVTVFLDTCYSGTTRGTETLIASRPIAIRAKEQAVPEGFTVMTAAAGDQTAKPLEEAKHGMFSYFLMKGMEGDADANQDDQITAGELHSYVQQNVIQQSSGSQTPELQGDSERVLVRFE